MALPDASSLNTCLIECEARYSIYNGFSASASFVAVEGSTVDTTDYRWTPLRINLDTIEGSANITPGADGGIDDADLTGSVNIINGLVTSEELQEDSNGKRVKKFSITSFASGLARKSLATESYSDAVVGNVLLDVLQVYLGYQADAYDIGTITTTRINSMIQGDNAYEELKRLARIGFADLFVQVGGDLVASPWKDHASDVDYELPLEYVYSSSRVRDIERPASRVTVRGSQVSPYGAGVRVLSGEPIAPNEVTRSKCHIPGADAPEMKLPFKQVSGKDQDLKNAGFLFDNHDFVSAQKAEVNEAEVTAIVDDAYESFDANTIQEIPYKILSRPDSPEVTSDPSTRLRGIQSAVGRIADVIGRVGEAPQLKNTLGLGTDQSSGDSDKNRLTMVVSDADLVNDYGIIGEQIDNPYIPDGMTAFYMAIRQLQENRIGMRRYQLQVAYMPDLRLNHVVAFLQPNSGDTITGRITDITYKHTLKNGNVSMSITVEAFTITNDEETVNVVGGNTYISENLLKYPNAEGINGLDWAAQDCYCISGHFAFDGGSLTQTLNVVTGLTYTLTADLTLLSDTGNFSASVAAASSLTYTSTGTLNWSFAPSSSPASLTFSSSGQWLMKNPKLTVTVPNF